MGEIRSAREIAMEKIAGLGEVTEAERMSWKYVPEGQKLAARYLKDGGDLLKELGKYDDKARRYVASGFSEVLIRNLELPRNDALDRKNEKVMDGLAVVKKDTASLERVFNNLGQIFNHFMVEGAQQKKQAYAQLKEEFEAQLRQAVQQQLGTSAGINLDVERQPQFQQEWRKLQAELESQYLKLLDECKQELMAIE